MGLGGPGGAPNMMAMLQSAVRTLLPHPLLLCANAYSLRKARVLLSLVSHAQTTMMGALKAHENNPMLSAQDNAIGLAKAVQGAAGGCAGCVIANFWESSQLV
jgi:hypothetical protein